MESPLIICDKAAFKKPDYLVPLDLFCYDLSGSYVMFYNIIWCPSVPLWVYNCCFFSLLYYAMKFTNLLKLIDIIVLVVIMRSVVFESAGIIFLINLKELYYYFYSLGWLLIIHMTEFLQHYRTIFSIDLLRYMRYLKNQ